jgi:hypothetical protein
MSGDDWQSERLEVSYQEACRTLDAQRETVSELEEKSMRMVRFTALLLGVLVSFQRFADGRLQPELAATGGVLLLGSVVFGVEAFSESDIPVGVKDEFLRRLVTDEFGERAWNDELVRTYSWFVAANASEIRRSSLLFRVQQLCFSVGLVSAAAAVAF